MFTRPTDTYRTADNQIKILCKAAIGSSATRG